MTRLTCCVLLLLSACDPSTRPAAGDGGPPPPPRDGGRDAGDGLDCVELLACVAACPAADLACEEACTARATSEGLARATALADCGAAAGCSDEACLAANCDAELRACAGTVTPPIGTAPARIAGTLRDQTPLLGLDSMATVTFVRDDAAGDAAGVRSPGAAFYRVAQIDYLATQNMDMGCRYTASEMVSFTDPPAGDNHLSFDPESGEYTLVTTLSEPRPGALLVECPGTAPRREQFAAENNVSTGTTIPVSDGRTFSGSAMSPGGIERTWTWDLTGT